MSNGIKLLIVFMGVVALLFIGGAKQFGGWNPAEKPKEGEEEEEATPAQKTASAPAQTSTPTDPKAAGKAPAEMEGPKNAPVTLTIYYTPDNDCHQEMVSMARDLISENQNDVRIRLVSTQTPEGAAECKKVAGCEAAGMAVNGRGRWSMAQGHGGANSVQFYGACERSGQYGQEHVKAALSYSLKKAGRKPAEKLASTELRVVENKAAK
jgi:hypothetical protein